MRDTRYVQHRIPYYTSMYGTCTHSPHTVADTTCISCYAPRYKPLAADAGILLRVALCTTSGAYPSWVIDAPTTVHVMVHTYLGIVGYHHYTLS